MTEAPVEKPSDDVERAESTGTKKDGNEQLGYVLSRITANAFGKGVYPHYFYA